MLNAIQAGILTSSTKERLEQLEETKRELESRIAEEKLAKPKVTEEFIRFWLLRFRKLNMNQKDQRQALIDTFINAIYLYDDKVLITFNYKEGTETISFGEATEAAAKEKKFGYGLPWCTTATTVCGRRFCCARLFCMVCMVSTAAWFGPFWSKTWGCKKHAKHVKYVEHGGGLCFAREY